MTLGRISEIDRDSRGNLRLFSRQPNLLLVTLWCCAGIAVMLVIASVVADPDWHPTGRGKYGLISLAASQLPVWARAMAMVLALAVTFEATFRFVRDALYRGPRLMIGPTGIASLTSRNPLLWHEVREIRRVEESSWLRKRVLFEFVGPRTSATGVVGWMLDRLPNDMTSNILSVDPRKFDLSDDEVLMLVRTFAADIPFKDKRRTKG